MEVLTTWIKVSGQWLTDNAVWLGSLGAIAGVLALLPLVLPKRKPPEKSGGNTIGPGGDGNVSIGGSVAMAGPDGIAVVNIRRDELDRETIAILQAVCRQLLTKNEGLNEGLEEQIAKAVTGLDRVGADQGRPASVIDEAKRELARGNFAQAESLYREHAERKRAEGTEALKEAAESYRSLGALAYLHNTEAAVSYYREATRLDPDNLDGWNQLGTLHYRTGDLAAAENNFHRVLTLATREAEKAVAYGNLGLVYQTRGELDRSLEMHEKALEVNKALGHKQGMAANYGNLGIVFQMRGKPDRAMEMHKRALEIEKELGHKEGMANQYGNIGIVYMARGELDRSVEMHEKALEVNKALGHKQGMAADYGNLGNVYQMRGKSDRAMEMYEKALEVNKVLGHKQGMAANYGNLGLTYHVRGKPDRALEMHEKALEIEKELGHKEGMAKQCINLGLVYQTRGELDRAVEYWQHSLALFNEIGSPNVAIVQDLLGEAGSHD